MKSLTHLFTTLSFLVCCVHLSFTQITGSRENSQSTPKVAEAGTLNGGSFTGDVNTMTGQYNASVPLGSVSTPGGLSFTLSLEHNSSFSVGTNEPMSSGIPYGEGWDLSLPTVSVQTDVFHRFRNWQECRNNDATDYSTNDLSSDYLATWEGDLFWFAPTVSIPGVGGGRAVFKYIDASSGNAFFVLNTFETPMDIVLTPANGWEVRLPDGTIYHFGTVLQQYRAPSNKRLMAYDPDLVTMDDGVSGAALVEDTYEIDPQTIRNAIEPKEEYATWHCDLITSKNLFGQAIHFEYKKFGQFNFFSEFQQENYRYVHKEIFDDASLGYLPDYTAYRELLLKSVTSYVVDETPVDILELEYDKLTEAYTVGSPLLNPDTDEDVYMVDELFCATVVERYASDGTSFSGWKRYKHVYRDQDISILDVHPSNPYINSSNNSYFRESVGDTNDAVFDHGFLESPRLDLSNSGGAGDLFEVRTRVVRESGTDLKNGNGTIDIALVTSDGSMATYSEPSNGNILSSLYRQTRGEQVFSTFNMALKWQMGWQQSAVETSNFFVMPNLPENFEGFNIQVGPGNSDIKYDYYDTELYNTFDPAGSTVMSNALAAYPQLFGLGGLKSAASVPRNFGTGHPWGMMAPIYNHMARSAGNGTYSAAHHEDLYIGTWMMTPADESYLGSYHHNPTKFNEDVKITEVELIRYSKIAYMLRSVKQYKINGEYSKSVEEEGKKLIAQKRLDYTVQTAPRIRNLDYQQNQQIVMESNKLRQIILLSKIHDVPVYPGSGSIYDTDFGLSNPEEVLSTELEYANILPSTTGTIYFDENKPYQGMVHYALVKFIDHLGGETSVEYYPVTDGQTRITNNGNFNVSCASYVISAYGSNRSFTIHPAVRYLTKEVENYDIPTGMMTSPERKWEYVYDLNSSIYNRRELHLPSEHFHGSFHHNSDRAFGKVTVYSPALPGGTRNYTVYEYHGKQAYPSDANDFTTLENFLYYGKPKSVKEYDHDGVIHSSTEYEYAYTLAFENGYKRPNFVREGIGLYDHPIFRDYEYKDYYFDQEMSVDNPSGPGVLTGHEAKIVLASDVLKEGTSMMEKPKFLPLYFFNELTDDFATVDANGDSIPSSVTNPDYFLNSYFIKKTAEINRTYEDGLSKSSIAVAPADPVFEPISPDPQGPGIVNPVIADAERDDELISELNTLGDDSYERILAAVPLADTVLGEVISSTTMTAQHKTDILLTHTGGFSDPIWELIIDKYGSFTPVQLNQLVYLQPHFSDATQDYLIQEADTLTWDDQFYQSLLLRNPSLSDSTVLKLCDADNIPGESFRVVLAGQAHQMTSALITEIIASDNFNSGNCHEILTDQWLTEGHYNDLILSTLDDEAIVTLIEEHYVKPTDATVEDFIDIRRPSLAHAQRVVDVLDRELGSALYTLLTATYERPEIIFPINVNPLNQYCGNTTTTGRIYIENKTEYTYFEADYRGVAQGKAFEVLLGKIESVDEPSAYPMTIPSPLIGPSNLVVPHLQLKHEPSWQLFSVKTSSVHLPDAFNREEYFYYYDLQNRYDRIWHNFDQGGNFDYVIYQDETTLEILDTLFANLEYTSHYTDWRFRSM